MPVTPLTKEKGMNLASAKNAQEFCNICDRDAAGRATVVQVPGHQGHRYEVRLERPDKKTIQVECVDPEEGEPCKGCQHGKVCYHALAAAMRSAAEHGFLYVCDSYESAMRVEGGLSRLIILKAKKGGGVAYCRFYLHKKKKRKIVIQVQEPIKQGALFDESIGPYDK